MKKQKQSAKFKVKKHHGILFLVAAVVAAIGAMLNTHSPHPSAGSLPALRAMGIYAGFGDASGLAKHQAFEQWLGKSILVADANLDNRTWSMFTGSSWGQFEDSTSLFRKRQNIRPALTVPLCVIEVCGSGTNRPASQPRNGLLDTANGVNDSKYQLIGNRLIASGHANAIIRLGHEGDGRYFPWSYASGNAEPYKQAFQHVVTVLRSLPGQQFVFDYQGESTFNQSYNGTGITNAQAAYPGDAYVDIIGVDIYDTTGTTWAVNKARLDYAKNLAIQHGKPMSIPEWGLWHNGDNPTFIQNMYDWMNATPASGPGSLLYHAYFHGLSYHNLDSFPNSKAKFKQLFGQTESTTPPVSNPPASDPSPPTPPPTSNPPASDPSPPTPPPTSNPPASDPIVLPPAGTDQDNTPPPKAEGTVQLQPQFPNNEKAAEQQIFINGQAVTRSTDGQALAELDTTTLQNGEHAVKVVVKDADGNIHVYESKINVDNNLSFFEWARNKILPGFLRGQSGRKINIILGGFVASLVTLGFALYIIMRLELVRALFYRFHKF